MSWQEELRKLDEELAAGQLSADEYRVRRDQVLSSAVSQHDNPTGTEPGQPVANQPAESHNAVDNTAESTQVVSPVSPAQHQTPGSSATNHGSPAAQPPPNTQQATPEAQTAQVQNSAAGGYASQQAPQFDPGQSFQSPWNAPAQDAMPPWGASDYPPLTADSQKTSPNTAESFEAAAEPSHKKFITVAAVVVVAALAVGGYFVFAPDSGNNAAPPPSPAPTTATTDTPKNDDLAIEPLPGDAHHVDDVETFADMAESWRLTDDEREIYDDAKPGETHLAVSETPANLDLLTLTVETDSAENAFDAVDDLVDLQEKYDMESYPDSTPTGVHVQQIKKRDDNPAAIRTHYAHGATVVRIDVSGDDLEELNSTFKKILSSQLDRLPADDEEDS